MSNSVISKLLAISNRIGFPLDLPNPNLPLRMQKATSCWVFVNFRDQIITPRNLMPTSLSRTPATLNYFSIPLRVRDGGVLLYSSYCIMWLELYLTCRFACDSLWKPHLANEALWSYTEYNLVVEWILICFIESVWMTCDVVETALHEGRVGRLMLTLSLLCSHSPNLGEHTCIYIKGGSENW